MADSLSVLDPAEAGDGMVLDLRNLPYRRDRGLDARAIVGLIVLASDQCIETEFRRAFERAHVALYHSRVFNAAEITPENLKQMEARIADAVGLLAPGVELDVVGFGCTSGAMVIGEEAVAERVRSVRPGVKVNTPMSAAFAAFEALGARRIGLFTPYIDQINQAMRRFIESKGFQVTAMGSFNESDDLKVAGITLDSVHDAVLQVGAPDAVDAVFVSCTNLRLTDGARTMEAALGKPVTSSNHAMAWHCLRLAGVDDALPELGSLYTKSLA